MYDREHRLLTYPPTSQGTKHAPAAIAVHKAHSFQLQESKSEVRDWLRSIWEGLTQAPCDSVAARFTRPSDGSIGFAIEPGVKAVKNSADAARLLLRRIVCARYSETQDQRICSTTTDSQRPRTWVTKTRAKSEAHIYRSACMSAWSLETASAGIERRMFGRILPH